MPERSCTKPESRKCLKNAINCKRHILNFGTWQGNKSYRIGGRETRSNRGQVRGSGSLKFSSVIPIKTILQGRTGPPHRLARKPLKSMTVPQISWLHKPLGSFKFSWLMSIKTILLPYTGPVNWTEYIKTNCRTLVALHHDIWKKKH